MEHILYGQSELFAFDARCAAKIEIQDTDFASNFPGYPLLINPTSSATLANLILDADGPCPALNGGGDLRVVTDPFDESTQLAIEVVTLITDNDPANGEMELWLEAGTVLATGGKTLYILWGITGATQPARDAANGSEAVWDQAGGPDWKYVSHMNDLTTSTLNDSSPQDITTTKLAANTPIESTAAPFVDSKSQNFHDDQNDYAQTASTAALNLGEDFIVMCWVKNVAETPDGFNRFLSRKLIFSNTDNWEMGSILNSDTTFELRGSGSTVVIPTLPGGGTWSSGDWHHIAIEYAGTTATPIIDGVVGSSGTIEAVSDVTRPLRFGWDLGGTDGSWDGEMDEIRLLEGTIGDDNVISIYEGMDDPVNHVSITIL